MTDTDTTPRPVRRGRSVSKKVERVRTHWQQTRAQELAEEQRLAALYAHLPTPPGDVERWNTHHDKTRHARFFTHDLSTVTQDPPIEKNAGNRVLVAECGLQFSDGQVKSWVYVDAEKPAQLDAEHARELSRALLIAADTVETQR